MEAGPGYGAGAGVLDSLPPHPRSGLTFRIVRRDRAGIGGAVGDHLGSGVRGKRVGAGREGGWDIGGGGHMSLPLTCMQCASTALAAADANASARIAARTSVLRIYANPPWQ